MSAAATLHSNHVNYLIWRYLQEQGFEHAAIAFTRDWRRTGDIASDPDALPFAHAVQRNDLVSVVQYGVHYDQARAKAGLNSGERKFVWSKFDGRGAPSRRRDSTENGAKSRSTDSGRRKDKLPVARSTAARTSRKGDVGEAQFNGDRDAMDIDTGSADGEPEQDPTSPTVASESDQAGPVERYDSMDVLVQTDLKVEPKTSTISWHLDKPSANIQRVLWSPRSEEDDTKTLLTVGEDLCRFYQIPVSARDAKHLEHFDEPTLSSSCGVTAATWRPDGTAACCAIDGLRELPSGTQLSQQVLLERHQDGTSTTLQLGLPSLEPPGIVLAIHYSPDSRYVLALRTNMKRSMIQVWSSARTNVDAPPLSESVAWRLFDNQVSDAQWISNDTFAICGDQGLSACYQVDESQGQDLSTLPTASVLMRGLIPRNSNIIEGTTDWDVVRFDHRHRIAAFVSRSQKRLVVTPKLRSNDNSTSPDVEFILPDAKSLQPVEISSSRLQQDHEQNDDSTPETFLALGYGDGTVAIYAIRYTSDQALVCSEVVDLNFMVLPVAALAWSTNGEYLAVSNSSLVQVWSRDSFARTNGAVHSPRAMITWRRPQSPGGPADGENGDEVIDCEPSLSWSADGTSLAFAINEQVSVVGIDPPLQASMPQPVVNGHRSP
ncbi:hypothetical protein CB0940_01390 [Cercospora beticola]|uniref:Uncharacterized protein n=1 Tax=Cercospora beticola TaxID=122368 RepID=A0A2G5ICN4_CERBT|nr:hypothetical protein CB0940_01390 [Cercospora beticola]PIB02531.1 hypothetical protein CB0940_01390 [Cercospora beticola]WPA96829.1 hypothetical protein RHO25_001437 [Cercospora beticola]CAK1354799.1 unnamed protein product [Cercospora beticola]